MAASKPIFSVTLSEDDVPGAKLSTSDLNEHSVLQLKRWLECRGLPSNGNKQQLVERCRTCINSKQDSSIHIAVDGGKWYAKKVQQILEQTQRSEPDTPDTDIPLLPVTGWAKFPSCSVPQSFCYGTIYEHIITSARLIDAETGQSDPTMSVDFNTSKPMKKGRQYFVSGHVTKLFDTRKGNFHFFKAVVLASYTQDKHYNVSVTLRTEDAKVIDASCECKASAMGRCSHVAALLFALEDYTILFGYDVPSCTSQLCQWNVGRKKRKNPQPAHAEQYCKKAAPDRILKHDPRPAENRTPEADEDFINNFIATLPSTQFASMFDQILEINYKDYVVDKELLKVKVDWALSLNQTDQTEPYEIAGTGDQASCELWHQVRSCKVTASVAKDVATTQSGRGLFQMLNRNLWGLDKIETAAMSYGKKHEDEAFESYLCRDGELKSKTGFWVNPCYPGLGCSPDGLIKDTNGVLIGLMEIKCPQVLQKTLPLDINQLKPSQQKNLCYTVENCAMKLKRTHKYFYQVQMQMAVCNVNFCDFVLWSPKGMTVERLLFDKEFWNTLQPKLHRFYINTLLPEFFEMRVPRRLLPVSLDL